MHHLLLSIHILAATIWVGGHLVLCLGILPDALRKKDVSAVLAFEKRYEKIAIPSLLVLVITGICMSYMYGITLTDWFHFKEPVERVISVKLILLICTLVLGSHGRIRLIPRLNTSNLNFMAAHIILITMLGVTMLVAGTFVRFGGW